MLIQKIINKVFKNNIIFCLFFVIFCISSYYFYNNYHNNKIKEDLSLKANKENLLYRAPDSSDYYKVYNSNSKFTVINYISLDCPYCRSAYLMEDKLGDKYNGKLNIIYRHNPLNSQILSAEKALISECVYEQSNSENFFKFISSAFSNFDKINEDNNWIKKIALNYVKSELIFNTCLEDLTIISRTQKQKNENIIAGITYTPTLLIYQDGKFVKKFEKLGASQVIKIMDFYSEL